MTRSIRTLFVSAIVLGIGAFAAPAALAQGQCGVERKVSTGTLDEATWKQLNGIYEDVGEERYNEAYDDLQRLLTRAGRDAYLQAIIYNALAQVEWARENFTQALNYFEKTIELDALPNRQHFNLMYQVAQLYYMQERYNDALQALDLWFCKVDEESIVATAYVLKASIHAAKPDFPKALEAIDKAIEMSDDPKEAWFTLKLAAHFELEQFPQAADTLEVMIELWPDKKTYWMQLSQTYFKLKQDEKALATAALAYRKGLLDKQADILYLSSMYSNHEVPYKAAQVLQKGIQDGVVEPKKQYWTSVADNWYAAEELERALDAYLKAGEASLDGNIDLRRGYILVDLERWEEARVALNAALDKGGLDERKTGEAHLLKGMAEFNLGNFDAARQAWTQASRYERSREPAQQWLNHLREEQARAS